MDTVFPLTETIVAMRKDCLSSGKGKEEEGYGWRIWKEGERGRGGVWEGS